MSSGDEDLCYLPNGELNVPFILTNANLLLLENELELAASLFQLVKGHTPYAHCAHYGIGQCFLKAQCPRQAVQAFEKAFLLEKRPYIGTALLEALMACGDLPAFEKRAIELAREFSFDEKFVEIFRRQYQMCLANAK